MSAASDLDAALDAEQQSYPTVEEAAGNELWMDLSASERDAATLAGLDTPEFRIELAAGEAAGIHPIYYCDARSSGYATSEVFKLNADGVDPFLYGPAARAGVGASSLSHWSNELDDSDPPETLERFVDVMASSKDMRDKVSADEAFLVACAEHDPKFQAAWYLRARRVASDAEITDAVNHDGVVWWAYATSREAGTSHDLAMAAFRALEGVRP